MMKGLAPQLFSTSTVVLAMGDGKAAARQIDDYLQGDREWPDELEPAEFW